MDEHPQFTVMGRVAPVTGAVRADGCHRLDQMEQAVAATVAHFERLDNLVNNAGLGPSNPAADVR